MSHDRILGKKKDIKYELQISIFEDGSCERSPWESCAILTVLTLGDKPKDNEIFSFHFSMPVILH